MPELRAEDIKIGRCYRGKKPAPCRADGMVNDRQVRWMSADLKELQYDGPAVQEGHHYPRLSMLAFLEWASHDVTDDLPPGDWQSWEKYREAKG